MDLSKVNLSDWANIATIIATAIAAISFISGIVALIYRFVHKRRKKDDDSDKGNSGGSAPTIMVVFVPVVFIVAGASAMAAVTLVGSGQVQGIPKDIVTIWPQASQVVVTVIASLILITLIKLLVRLVSWNARERLTEQAVQSAARYSIAPSIATLPILLKAFEALERLALPGRDGSSMEADAEMEIHAYRANQAGLRLRETERAKMYAALREADQAGKRLREAQRAGNSTAEAKAKTKMYAALREADQAGKRLREAEREVQLIEQRLQEIAQLVEQEIAQQKRRHKGSA